MAELTDNIGFIGAGNMAEAIIGAIIGAQIAPAAHIIISDIELARIQSLKNAYSVAAADSNKDVIDSCGIIFFAVKPQQIKAVLTTLAGEGAFIPGSRKKRCVSIAAGIRLAAFEKIIYDQLTASDRQLFPLIRVMPNTPALVRSGTSAICANEYAAQEDIEKIRTILSAMGTVFDCRETDMNAFTAVAGSGPAYGFYLIEAMAEAGHELGLEKSDAIEMAVSTLSGALKLLDESGAEPQALRRKVTSPGGTTEAALSVMEKHQVKSRIIEAVIAAAKRAAELNE
jgi:pyrroline-5-carboxylate reductase